MSINSVVDALHAARDKIFEHVGYVENWRVFPFDDAREMWWSISSGGHRVSFSPKKEILEHFLATDEDKTPFGNDLYSNEIYTQRHLPKWVYRGSELVLIVVDTHTDGNKFLQLFDPTKEIELELDEEE